MPHGFFSPGITQDRIFPLALNRSTAQGHEHRFFFFCELDFIVCHYTSPCILFALPPLPVGSALSVLVPHLPPIKSVRPNGLAQRQRRGRRDATIIIAPLLANHAGFERQSRCPTGAG